MNSKKICIVILLIVFLYDFLILFNRIGLIRTYPREIYAAHLVANGYNIYKQPNYSYFGGPIGPYYYGLIFYIFGEKISYLYIASHILYLIGLILVFKITVTLTNNYIALIVSFIYLTIDLPVFTLSQSIYSLIGIIANLLVIYLLFRLIDTEKTSILYWIGILCSIVILGKYQVGLPLLFILLINIWLFSKENFYRKVLIVLVSSLFLPIIVYSYLLFSCGANNIYENLINMAWHAKSYFKYTYLERLKSLFYPAHLLNISNFYDILKVYGGAFKDYIQIISLVIIIIYGAKYILTQCVVTKRQDTNTNLSPIARNNLNTKFIILILGSLPNIPQYLMQLTVEHFFTFANIIFFCWLFKLFSPFFERFNSKRGKTHLVQIISILLLLAIGSGMVYSKLKTRMSRNVVVETDFGHTYMKKDEAKFISKLGEVIKKYSKVGETVAVPEYAYFYLKDRKLAFNDTVLLKYYNDKQRYLKNMKDAILKSTLLIFQEPLEENLAEIVFKHFELKEFISVANWPKYGVYTQVK